MYKIGQFFLPDGAHPFGEFNQTIRIPISGSVPIFKEVAKIIDTPAFQRLRGVKQLGPTQYIYPGAVHTRFEHSLGTYYLALRYLDVLKDNKIFIDHIQPREDSFKIVLLAALLHDIGHYPYSHWIEEILGIENICRGIESHEDRAKDFILNADDGQIANIIKNDWHVDPISVCDLIKSTDESADVIEAKIRKKALRSIIDSMIDVDKVDYLQRDSFHCGVPYGVGFDLERLISSLHYDCLDHHICLTDKGQSSFSALLTSRSVMYKEVYWHKTVRACTAMFKRYFYEYSRSLSQPEQATVVEFLKYPDDKFILNICAKNNGQEIQESLKIIRDALMLPFINEGRKLYKPAHIYYHNTEHRHAHKNEYEEKYFNQFENIGKPGEGGYDAQLSLTLRLLNACKARHDSLNDLKDHEFIIEMAPIKNREGEAIFRTAIEN